MEFKRHNNIEYIEKKPAKCSEKMPALIYLHGAGTRQGTLKALSENPFYAESCLFSREDSDFVCFTPLCYANSWFDIFEQLQDFVNEIVSRPDIDKKRVYLMGASMGGYGTWQLAMSMPDTFAAIVPICGGGMYWNVWELHTTYVWAFHGKEDDCVFPEESVKMVNAINSQEGNLSPKLTLIDNVAHDAWNTALASKELYNWLLSKTKLNGDETENTAFADGKKFG